MGHEKNYWLLPWFCWSELGLRKYDTQINVYDLFWLVWLFVSVFVSCLFISFFMIYIKKWFMYFRMYICKCGKHDFKDPKQKTLCVIVLSKFILQSVSGTSVPCWLHVWIYLVSVRDLNTYEFGSACVSFWNLYTGLLGMYLLCPISLSLEMTASIMNKENRQCFTF